MTNDSLSLFEILEKERGAEYKHKIINQINPKIFRRLNRYSWWEKQLEIFNMDASWMCVQWFLYLSLIVSWLKVASSCFEISSTDERLLAISGILSSTFIGLGKLIYMVCERKERKLLQKIQELKKLIK